MSLPTDFSAVESNDYSYLFYCRNGSTISFLKSSEKREGNKVTYASTSVRLGAELITTGSPRISAVTYDSKDKKTKEVCNSNQSMTPYEFEFGRSDDMLFSLANEKFG